MDNQRQEQQQVHSLGEGERTAHRVHSRAENAWLPLMGARGEDSLASAETAPPRLGLAFILNDTEPHRDSMTPESDVTSPPGLLPQRRQVQWGSPDVAASRLWRERSVPPSLVFPVSPMWRVGETQHSDMSYESKQAMPALQDSPEAHGDDEDKEVQERGPKSEQKAEEKADAQPAPPATVSTEAISREEKRRGRTCRAGGCDNYIVHKGLCCRHGGARKCSTAGCDSTAKYMGLCWKHGGSTWCKVEGCSKRAKAKGRCWAHGGGTQCSHESCMKVAVSNGLCWAHGGGKRCLFDGCNRPGYERTNGFCDRHFEEMQGVNYFEV